MSRKVPRNLLTHRARESPPEGQMTLDLKPTTAIRLREKIPEDVHTLFVGISPATRSARIGHYYGGRANCFWKMIHYSGIWPVPVTPEDDDSLVAKGFGFTDLVTRPSPGSSHLTKGDFGDSRRRLKSVARRYRPNTIVFVGKRAAAVFSGGNTRNVDYGVQGWTIEDCAVFVVPSTSGASLAHTPYEAKLEHFKRLRDFMSDYYVVTRNS